jgi:hypothetical protein
VRVGAERARRRRRDASAASFEAAPENRCLCTGRDAGREIAPSRFEFVAHLDTALALGLEIPSTLLAVSRELIKECRSGPCLLPLPAGRPVCRS